MNEPVAGAPPLASGIPAYPAKVLFVTLAMNQTVFFEALGVALSAVGTEVAHLCFHERSHEYLTARGRKSFNAFHAEGSDQRLDLSRYSWPSLNLVLSHEKAAFEISDSNRLKRKLLRYLSAAETTLDAFSERDGAVVVVQELGGFISNIATFYAARRRGVDNIFIEPAFFQGRIAFLRNTFSAARVRGPDTADAGNEVKAYLEDAKAKQRVVIPTKDALHYRAPSKKLTDIRNVRRLVQKTIDRYVLGKEEEFGHVLGHVSRHVRMLTSSRALSARYEHLPPGEKPFVYYPLHVPADVALTIRSPQYVDQLALVDYLARVVPASHDVYIKEHPALIGAIPLERLRHLLKVRDNVHLLNPGIPNYAVLGRASTVITVNSKSGAEALLLGRPVIVLGDAFYSDCRLIRRVDSLADLPVALDAALAAEPLGREEVVRYFQDVWNATWPGELYVAEADNIGKFSESLLRYLARTMPIRCSR